MTTDQNPDRLADLRTEYANTGMVKYDGAVWLISQVVVLGEQVQQLAAAVSVPPPADQTALRDRIRRAICEAEGFGWDTDMLEPDEYGEVADAVLAVLPEQTDRATLLRAHVALAAQAGRDQRALARIRQMADTWEQRLPEVIRTPAVVSAIRAALPAETEPQAAADEYARALATPPSAEAAAYIRERLERPAVGEQPETQEARPECAHCWREIENRGTPSMNGSGRNRWVHIPGGFEPCIPQKPGSPRAEPRTPE